MSNMIFPWMVLKFRQLLVRLSPEIWIYFNLFSTLENPLGVTLHSNIKYDVLFVLNGLGALISLFTASPSSLKHLPIDSVSSKTPYRCLSKCYNQTLYVCSLCWMDPVRSNPQYCLHQGSQYISSSSQLMRLLKTKKFMYHSYLQVKRR